MQGSILSLTVGLEEEGSFKALNSFVAAAHAATTQPQTVVEQMEQGLVVSQFRTRVATIGPGYSMGCPEIEFLNCFSRRIHKTLNSIWFETLKKQGITFSSSEL